MKVLNSLTKQFNKICSNNKLSLIAKQKYLVKLQDELKLNYIPCDEYKRFKTVLQNYIKKLKRKNTSYFKETGFGDVIVNTNTLPQTDYLVNIQNIYIENNNRVQLNIKDYLYKETEYNYHTLPFIGTDKIIYIFNEYLYTRHVEITNTQNENKKHVCIAKPVEIFGSTFFGGGTVHYSQNHQKHNIDGFDEVLNELDFDDNSYAKQLLIHLRTIDNAFTMFSPSTDTHAVSAFLHKYHNKLYIYVLDNNNIAVDNVMNLCDALKRYFALKLGILCKYYYIAEYMFNFGHGDDFANNEFLELGYCALISQLFMNIMYTNMVVYKNISYNSSPNEIISFIKTMQKYLYIVFVLTNKWRHFCTNFAYKVFGDLGFF